MNFIILPALLEYMTLHYVNLFRIGTWCFLLTVAHRAGSPMGVVTAKALS